MALFPISEREPRGILHTIRHVYRDARNTIDVDPNGNVGTLAEAFDRVVSPSFSSPYVIRLGPGVHTVSATASIPAYTSIIGAGPTQTILDFGTANFRTLQHDSGTAAYFANFSIRCKRSNPSSSEGIIRIQTTAAHGTVFQNVNFYLAGNEQACLHCNQFSSVRLINCLFVTDATAIEAVGYWYLDNCNIVLIEGEGGTSQRVAVSAFPNTATAVRFYVNGGSYGTGYFTADDIASDLFTDTDAPSTASDTIGFLIPSDHTAASATGTRFQLRNVECYARNEAADVSSVNVNAIRAAGAGAIRIEGGLFQAEAPNDADHQPLAVVNAGTWNSGTTWTEIENLSARITSSSGNISGPGGVLKITASTTLKNYHHFGTILVDATSGAVTVTLQAVSAQTDPMPGSRFKIVKTDSSANAVTVTAGSGTTIEGSASISLASQYDNAELVYGETDDTVWYRID